MYYSYAMGVGSGIEALEGQGFAIEKFGDEYGVAFPAEKACVWEQFITNYLQLGYWNEYLASGDVIFLFHLEDGIKKYVVKNYDNEDVLSLCERLCDCKFQSLKDMLKENHYYCDKIR